MNDPLVIIVVVSLLAIILYLAFRLWNQSISIKNLEGQNNYLLSFQRNYNQNIEPELIRLRNFYSEYQEAPEILSKNKELTDQLASIAQSYGAWDDKCIFPHDDDLSDLIEKYSFLRTSEELDAAKKHTEDLVKSGTATVTANASLPVAPGARACLLDAFNGHFRQIRDGMSHHTQYSRIKQQVRSGANQR